MAVLNHDGMLFPLPEYDYNKEEQYVLYGTGTVAKSYYEQLKEKGIGVVFFIDSMSKEKTLYGKKICKPSEIERKELNLYRYILCTFTSAVSMENELLKLGVHPKNLIKSSKYTIDSFREYQMKGGKICIYPSFDHQEEYRRIEEKLNYYILPDLSIKMEAVVEISELKSKSKMISIVKQHQSYENYDLILVWNKKRLNDECLIKLNTVYCIDESFFQLIDLKILNWINYKMISYNERKAYHYNSKNRFMQLKEKKYLHSFVFALGPSLNEGVEKYLIQKDQACYKITCNGAIHNKNFLKKVQPNIYVVSDIFFLEMEQHEVLNAIVQYVNENECLLCLPKFWMPYMERKQNLNREKMIGFSENKSEICFPTINDLNVYSKAHNVLTRYAIPIASSLSDIVFIAGCDGAKMDNNGKLVVEHSEDKTFEICQQDVINHYSYVEQILEYGEEKNKSYYVLTNSNIPALKKRIYQGGSWC